MRRLSPLLALILAIPTADAKKTAPSLQIATPSLPPPALMIKRDNRSRSLRLTRVNIETSIVGHLAETQMTMTFHNPTSRVLEGDLYVPLPQGATISGYALDINGVMVDGVVVEKNRARQVFETEVRKGVDPGLIEWSKGSNFKTRVFPIPAKGTRTIRVRYVAEVTSGAKGDSYHLPLGFRNRVDSISLRIEAINHQTKPIVTKGGPSGFAFGPWRHGFVAQKKLSNAILKDDLHILLPKAGAPPVMVQTATDGTTYFTIRDWITPGKLDHKRALPRRIGIYWDASLSRANANHKRELQLLGNYLKSLGKTNLEVQLVVFRNTTQPVRRFQLPSQYRELTTTLRNINYDGATQLGRIAPNATTKTLDLILLFTDGISNFGSEHPGKFNAPIYTINDATTANHAALRSIATQTGGTYLNLQRINLETARRAIGSPIFAFISAHGSGFEPSNIYPRVREPIMGLFAMAGKLTGSEATVTLKYGWGNSVAQQRTFKIKRATATKGSLLRRYWAQKKLDHLLAFPKKNQDAITRLGRTHSIVTPGTSLIVLERLDQYVEHQIRPPATLAKMRKDYDREVRNRTRIAKKHQQTKLAQVIRC